MLIYHSKKSFSVETEKQLRHLTLTRLDFIKPINPYVPLRMSCHSSFFSPHSSASGIFLCLGALIGFGSYYKFGFTREPSLRLKSYLKYKSTPLQSLPANVLKQKCTNFLRYKLLSANKSFDICGSIPVVNA